MKAIVKIELYLQENQIDDDGWYSCGLSMNEFSHNTLTQLVLHLGTTKIERKSVSSIINGLIMCAKSTLIIDFQLEIENGNIASEGVSKPGENIVSIPSLVNLIFVFDNLKQQGDDCLKQISDQIQSHKTLSFIILSFKNCGISDAGAISLCEGIAKMEGIQYISFELQGNAK
ncbi:hypothetical protein ABPG72_001421 [Tetrahymena utriculariae]